MLQCTALDDDAFIDVECLYHPPVQLLVVRRKIT
jgi:hypothetical protein